MPRLALLLPALAFASLLSCGPIELRVGKSEGVRPLNGSFHAELNTPTTTRFVCGDAITIPNSTRQYSVTTLKVAGGCRFTFDEMVEILSPTEYQSIKDFKVAVRALNRVELEVSRLDLYDDTGQLFDLASRIGEAELWVNGERVITTQQVQALPRTVVLSGDGLLAIKDAVQHRDSCRVHVMAQVVVLDAATRSGVHCEYESQPTFVLSTASL